jgi:hypothetical protein
MVVNYQCVVNCQYDKTKGKVNCNQVECNDADKLAAEKKKIDSDIENYINVITAMKNTKTSPPPTYVSTLRGGAYKKSKRKRRNRKKTKKSMKNKRRKSGKKRKTRKNKRRKTRKTRKR